MTILLVAITIEDLAGMAGIFNHYVEHTFSTYTETPVSVAAFEELMAICPGYPALLARDESGAMVGFGILRPFSMIPAFFATAELTCYLAPGFTRRGIGTMILQALESAAGELGITSIIASISSLNEDSLQFHLKSGFAESGRLKGIGRKRGVRFDVVYLQKEL
jgi:phosphinothricin acetyltransferase